MKSNEIAGTGNHNTALFWEYDTRLGRRWNLDPKPQVGISQYSVFNSNPIALSDLNGDYPFLMQPLTPGGIAKSPFGHFAKGVGMSLIRTVGGFTSFWEHGKTNPNAMSFKDIGNSMANGVIQPIVNVLKDPTSAESWGELVTTALMFKAGVREGEFKSTYTFENGTKANISLSKLNKALGYEEKASYFNKDGSLKASVTMKAKPITNVDMSKSGNTMLIQHLTADGSSMADWQKMSATVEVKGANGLVQSTADIHYYQNAKTGKVDMSYDYKAILGSDYYQRITPKGKDTEVSPTGNKPPKTP